MLMKKEVFYIIFIILIFFSAIFLSANKEQFGIFRNTEIKLSYFDIGFLLILVGGILAVLAGIILFCEFFKKS
jgi:hypothetical protein